MLAVATEGQPVALSRAQAACKVGVPLPPSSSAAHEPGAAAAPAEARVGRVPGTLGGTWAGTGDGCWGRSGAIGGWGYVERGAP